ncbi:right-handed parallel beta-helix repeat-containing protein [Flavihumibacter fluvii]|uniref:right-handed parallel beta-helix repeat-containing protein n=1 Tax=Flavihumibacter fluvii TaxID=2838157 RepID=UPI001BDEDE5E|nr:right-handed parallel beta-helix repeat-containing protein [Flavihumibacter fluvii]ULQ50620.1 right-handed parallel beta-helix repeat-containing protein [Flavihumibacter fluvii]
MSLLLTLTSCYCYSSVSAKGKAYYLSVHGNDGNPGSIQNPWQSLSKLSSLKIRAGDSILLEGGQTFEGTVRLGASDAGTAEMPVYIGSYGKGKSTIASGNKEGVIIYNTSFIELRNINLKGAGRNTGNTSSGLAVMYSKNIFIDSVNISGFQKSGLLIFSSSHVFAQFVYTSENGFAGISVDGEYQEYNSHDIILWGCTAENNPGDPSDLENHSGNGIIAGSCRKVTIEYCVATNNGWDMPRKGNGPVGISTYESDSVLIQHCISYRNKTSKGGGDGGGFALDGGVKNSTIRFCLSYENEGSGYGIFQYDGASYWYNNTIINCISENDGAVSAAQAGIFIWNGAEDATQFHNFYFRNNIVYNDTVAAISYEEKSLHAAFNFSNSIFVSKKNLINNWRSGRNNSHFICNNWWSIVNEFNIDGQRDFNRWSEQLNEEMQGDNMSGTNIDPAFRQPGKTTLKDPFSLKSFDAYLSPLIKEGMGFSFSPN